MNPFKRKPSNFHRTPGYADRLIWMVSKHEKSIIDRFPLTMRTDQDSSMWGLYIGSTYTHKLGSQWWVTVALYNEHDQLVGAIEDLTAQEIDEIAEA